MSNRNPAEAPAIEPLGLSALPTLKQVQDRLGAIFPPEFPDRDLLVGTLAARVVFVLLYGGFVEGAGRFLRPAHVYLFTESQKRQTTNDARQAWVIASRRPGFRPRGRRWYADTGRETIRDDLLRNRLLPLGAIAKNSPVGHETTSSAPVYYLRNDFAALFHVGVSSSALADRIRDWRERNLSSANLQRMALIAQGAQARGSDVLIDMPDGSRIRVASGASNLIIKGLIEQFARRHLVNPAVIWLSASDRKAYPQFVELAGSVGLAFDLSAELPDLILADLAEPVRFYFCEAVATDGAITTARRRALLNLVKRSNVPESAVRFVSAFEDRGAAALRKSISQLALDTFVWFRTEPSLLVMLTTQTLANFDVA